MKKDLKRNGMYYKSHYKWDVLQTIKGFKPLRGSLK